MSASVFIRTVPFHVFLLPVFYILHKVNAYYGFFPARFPLFYLALYTAGTVLLYLLTWLFFKNRTKAGTCTFIILLIVFFFGKGIDLLRSVPMLQSISSYKIIMPLLLMLVIACTVYIKKSARSFRKITVYLNLALLIFLLIEAGQFALSFFSNNVVRQSLAAQGKPLLDRLPDIPLPERPDIFFIVFDEYASSLSLKKYFHYDNSAADASLLSQRFYIAGASKSNYNYTPYSVASSFNSNYFSLPLEQSLPSPITLLKGTLYMRKSIVPRLLYQAGYTVKNIGVLELEDHPAPSAGHFLEANRTIFYEETIWNRISKEIGWNFFRHFPDYMKKKEKTEQKKLLQDYRSNYQKILSELKSQQDTPKFIYGHIMMPHVPYIVNGKGELLQNSGNGLHQRGDSLYLAQLRYCNAWIDSFAKASNMTFPRPRVVIIEGDHGYRFPDDGLTIRDRSLMNLSSYYFSDSDYHQLYDSISPVNSFRIVFNKYFHTRLSLLKDSTIMFR